MSNKTTELQRARAKSGLSCSQVGDVLGLSKSSVSRIERGVMQPTAETAADLAEYFGISFEACYGPWLDGRRKHGKRASKRAA